MMRYQAIGMIAAALSSAAPAFADLYWVGGNGDWNEPNSWTSEPGEPAGDGPPGPSDTTRLKDVENPFTVGFLEDGTAHRVELESVDATFDLDGHTLDLARRLTGSPPNTVLVDSAFTADAGTDQTTQVTLTGGDGASGFLGAQALGNGVVTVTITPDATWAVNEATPIVNVFGDHVELVVRGRLDLEQFVTEPIVRINDHATLTVDGGVLGNQGGLRIGNLSPGGQFTVSNDGVATSNDAFVVGDTGAGRVDLLTGGDLTTQGPATLGRAAGVRGDARVADPASNWFFEDELIVGDEGLGFLSVVSQGNIESFNSADTFLARTAGSQGELEVSTGGTFRSGGSLYVGGDAAGAGGTGTLRVRRGGQNDPPGRLEIDGTLKIWNDGLLSVDGGIVDAGSLEMPISSGELVLEGGGVINANGVTLAATAGAVELNHGEINVSGGTFNSAQFFRFGDAATPVTIRLLDGARADVSLWVIGNEADGVGVTEVARSGAAGGLFASFDISVGGTSVAADGTLNVTDGGKARADDEIVIGRSSGAVGSVLVQGVGADGRRSLLQSIDTLIPGNGEILVGREGTATLTIRDGGLAQSLNRVSIASMPGGKGTVSVGGAAMGSPATLSATSHLAVGGSAKDGTPGGDGLLEVLADGLVTVGLSATVHDDDAVKVQAHGAFESHSLTIDGGTFTVLGSTATALGTADVNGTTAVSGAGAKLQLLGGAFRTGQLDLGGTPSRLDWQAGTLGLTDSGLSIDQGAPLGADLTLNADQMLEVAGSVFIGSRGTLTLDSGVLDGGDEVLIEDGATVMGAGTVRSPVFVENNGKLRPGLSPGELLIEGPFAQTGSGSLFIEVGGLVPATGHDLLTVTGAADLGGTLEISLINGFLPQIGDEVTFLTASGGVLDEFDALLVPNVSGLILEVMYRSQSVVLRVSSSAPVPGDADGDGDVDAFDLGIWQTQFGMTGEDVSADFDDDGDVDAFDLGLWQTNFGTGVDATVPEPATVAILLAAAAAGGRARRARERAPVGNGGSSLGK